MANIVTMGELMLRLTPPSNLRFLQANEFNVNFGGGEANVAIALSYLGHKSNFISKFPNNEIGDSAVNFLHKQNVNTDLVQRGGDRLGIYYLEIGTGNRASKVIYDRAHSAITTISKKDFKINFDFIFKDVDWFHWSGITPALSSDSVDLLREILIAAKRNNVTVSCDINYRSTLWSLEDARETMFDLMKYVDVCIGIDIFVDKQIKPIYNEDNTIDVTELQNVLKEIHHKYNFKYTITTLRKRMSASDHNYGALVYDGDKFHTTKRYDIRIVDRVGGGDSFTSGLIHSLVNKNDIIEASEFAVAASAYKHTIQGDSNLSTIEEIYDIKNGIVSGRIQW